MSTTRARNLLTNAAMLAGTVLVLALVAEVTLRARTFNGFCVWAPHISHQFHPRPSIMPGVEGVSRFTTNAMGIRGADMGSDNQYRVLVLGGSASECLYLDDEETWAAQIGKRMNAAQDGREIWVGNIGQSGHDTRSHILELKELPPQLPRIDVVVAMVGVNDLSIRLAHDVHWERLPIESDAYQPVYRRTFAVVPESRGSWFTFSELRRRVSVLVRRMRGEPLRTKNEMARELRQDPVGTIYIDWRNRRRHATELRNELPDLTAALDEFADNVEVMIDLAAEAGVRIVFVTQPVLWQPDMPDDLSALLWMGGVGRFRVSSEPTYYTPDALAEGMERYNGVLRDVCDRRGIECVDLAADTPRDTNIFYDDCHFNEAGARYVGGVLSDYLLSRVPFDDTGE